MRRPTRRLKLGVLFAAFFGSIALACVIAGSTATRKLLGRDSPLLAFDATPGSNNEIYVTELDNASGVGPIRLTHDSANDRYPVMADGTDMYEFV